MERKTMREQNITSQLEELPEDLKKEVLDYIEFLILKYHRPVTVKKEGFLFDWEGGLSELKNRYTSVELQHKAMEWR